MAFSTLPESFRTITQTADLTNGKKLYEAVFPEGVTGYISKFKHKNALTGNILSNDGNDLIARVRWTQADIGTTKTSTVLPYNPTMMFMAVAIASIDHKLDRIQEKQDQILEFLEENNEAQLRTDLQNLADIQSQYKYNWNNEKFVTTKLGLVQDIKRNAKKDIDFYKKQMNNIINKKQLLLHWDQDTKKKFDDIQRKFKYYQLAIYLHSFASFLEVMLLGNFNAGFLDKVAEDIDDNANQYRLFYTECYDEIKTQAESSIESKVIKGMADIDKFIGTGIAKAPIINKGPVDEALLDASEQLEKFDSDKVNKTFLQFKSNQTSGVYVFVENVNKINELYDKPMKLIFDEDNLYIED